MEENNINPLEELVKNDLVARELCFETVDGFTICEKDRFDDMVGWGIEMFMFMVIIYLLYNRDKKLLY